MQSAHKLVTNTWLKAWLDLFIIEVAQPNQGSIQKLTNPDIIQTHLFLHVSV